MEQKRQMRGNNKPDQHHKIKERKLLGTFLLVVVLLSGCGTQVSEPVVSQQQADPAVLSWFTGETAVIDYEVPESRSFICVDQFGYLPTSEKMVICTGDVEETEFSVVSYDPEIPNCKREVVFTGALKQVSDEEDSGEKIFQGDFSSLMEPGTYVVTTEYLGESYPFQIAENLYASGMELTISELMKTAWTENVEESCMVFSNLLLAFELHPKAFIPEDADEKQIPELLTEIKEGIDALINCQDHKLGVVYAEPFTEEVDPTTGNPELTAMYSAVIAKFCYSLKEYDSYTATMYLPYAEIGWQYLSKWNLWEQIEPDEMYYLNTELFRITSKNKYKSAIELQLSQGLVESEGDFPGAYYGDMSYLTTTYGADLKNCTMIMNARTKKATKVTTESQVSPMLVRNEEQIEQTIQDAFHMIFVLRCNDNYENSCVLQNQIHYLNGMNRENESHISVYGTELADQLMTDSLYGMSQLVLLYSAIVS